MYIKRFIFALLALSMALVMPVYISIIAFVAIAILYNQPVEIVFIAIIYEAIYHPEKSIYFAWYILAAVCIYSVSEFLRPRLR